MKSDLEMYKNKSLSIIIFFSKYCNHHTEKLRALNIYISII